MDVSDFNLTHPASYHWAVQVARTVTEVQRVSDPVGLAAIKQHTAWMTTSTSLGWDWGFIMKNQELGSNKISKHLNWLARELLYKTVLHPDVANKDEINADVNRINQAVTLL